MRRMFGFFGASAAKRAGEAASRQARTSVVRMGTPSRAGCAGRLRFGRQSGGQLYFLRTVTKNAPQRSLPSASENHAFSFVLPAGSFTVIVAPVVFGSAFVSAFTPAMSIFALAMVGNVAASFFGLPNPIGSYAAPSAALVC